MLAGQNAAPQDNVFAHNALGQPRRGAARQDRPGDRPGAFRRRTVRLDRRERAAEAREGDRERRRRRRAVRGRERRGGSPTCRSPTIRRSTDPSQLATRDVTRPDGQPYKLQADPARKLKNLQGIPIVYVVAEKSGRNGEPVVAFLKQAGCDAEVMNLKDKGILGNGHFMMLENNRRQVFDAIRGWIEQKLPLKA